MAEASCDIWTVIAFEPLCSTHAGRTYLAIVSASSDQAAKRLLCETFPNLESASFRVIRGIGESEKDCWLIPEFMRPTLDELSQPEWCQYLRDEAVLFSANLSKTLWGHALLREARHDIEARNVDAET